MATYLYNIISQDWLSDNVLQLVIEPRSEAISYQAGQYVELLYPDGHFYPFSIANAPDSSGVLEFHVRVAHDDYALHQLLMEIDANNEIYLQGPMGHSIYRPHQNKEIILVAGGTGAAPMKAIIEAASEEDRLHLFWGVATIDEMYLHDVFLGFEHDERLCRYVPVVSSSEPWSGLNGWVHEVVVEQFDDLSSCVVYASGPAEMVHAARELYSHYGLDSEAFYTDML